MKILLGDFKAKVGRGNIFKPTIGNESLHLNSKDNGVRIVNFATSNNIVVQSTMFLHRNIHNYTWNSPVGKTHKQIDHKLIDRRGHSSILNVRSVSAADCETDQYLVVSTVRKKLAVSKQAAQRFDKKKFNVRKLNELDVKKRYQMEITKRFAALWDLSDDKDINRAWENIKGNIKNPS